MVLKLLAVKEIGRLGPCHCYLVSGLLLSLFPVHRGLMSLRCHIPVPSSSSAHGAKEYGLTVLQPKATMNLPFPELCARNFIHSYTKIIQTVLLSGTCALFLPPNQSQWPGEAENAPTEAEAQERCILGQKRKKQESWRSRSNWKNLKVGTKRRA